MKAYCINLDRRPDRWEKVKKQFLPEEIERVSAEDGNEINYGLKKPFSNELAGAISHLKVIQKAKLYNLPEVFIIEDDVVFNSDWKELYEKYKKQLPKKWDVVLFGGNHVIKPIIENKNLVKCVRSYALHAYIVKSSAYDTIINYLTKKTIEVQYRGIETVSVAADFFMADLQSELNWYCFKPHLAWQAEDFSDIQNKKVNYDFLK